MIITGDYKRLCINGWILAALLLLTYNVVSIIRLLNPIIIGSSEEVRLSSRKWQQLEERGTLVMKENWDDSDIKLIVSAFMPDHYKPTLDILIQKEKKSEIILPKLTGLMQVSDINGKIYFIAIIEGKRLVEKDEIKGFKVKKISKKGVALQKVGKSWFIPAPEVQFSLDQTETIKAETSEVSEDKDAKALPQDENIQKIKEFLDSSAKEKQ